MSRKSKMFISLILVLTLVSSMFFYGNNYNVYANQSNRVISDDITWTKEDSPYIINSNIIVEKGATLTIEPGVEVLFDGNYYMSVKGKLIAKGNDLEKISFNSKDELQYWSGIELISNDNELSNCIVQSVGINEYNESAITIRGSYNRITDSQILNNRCKGISIQNSNKVASKNEIMDCVLENNVSGIDLDGAYDNLIYGNDVLNSKTSYGIRFESTGGNIIVNNNILGNKNGIVKGEFRYDDIIKFNNIYDNLEYNFKLEYSSNVDLTNNYWGTFNEKEIHEKIFDYNDNYTLGKVKVDPCLYMEYIGIEKITLEEKELTLRVGERKRIGLKIDPQDYTASSLGYDYNSNIINVNISNYDHGFVEIYAKKVGTTELSVESGYSFAKDSCKITVRTDTLPVIDAEDRVVELGEPFDPLEFVTASDAEDGDLTSSIVVEGEVDINKSGKYVILYKVTDSDGNQATKEVKITVEVFDEFVGVMNLPAIHPKKNPATPNWLTYHIANRCGKSVEKLTQADFDSIEYIQITNASGEIPKEIGNLVNIESFDITHRDGGKLTGEIPREIGNLSNVEYLGLINNNLTGKIPAEIKNLVNLNRLVLPGNGLTGEIPKELGKLKSLNELDLASNELRGEIPSELGDIPLRTLNLYHNNLSGEFPENITGLEFISIGFNNIQSIHSSIKTNKNIGADNQKIILDEITAFETDGDIVIDNIITLDNIPCEPQYISHNGIYEDGKIIWKNITGKQNLYYTFSERLENEDHNVFAGQVTQPVNILTNEKPVIAAQDIVITVGDKFNPLDGVSASDKEDGDLTDIVTVEGEVDTSKAGKYSLIYKVVDSDGNKVTKEIIVTVNPKPNSIPEIYAEDIVINIGDNFDLLMNVTASDKEDGDLTDNIFVEGNVDTNKEGEYELTYKVIDSQGATATKVIKVTVVNIDKSAPKIIGKIHDTSRMIKGNAQPYSTIVINKVMEYGYDNIATTQADKDGNFSVNIYKLKKGDKLEIYAIVDSIYGEYVTEKNNIVVEDITPPEISVEDYDITNTTTNIAGYVKEASIIIIMANGVEIARYNCTEEYDESNHFIIKFPAQEIGTKISVIAIDESGNKSESIEKIVKGIYYNQWVVENNKWYYYNEYGSKVTGWLKQNNIWYYLKTDGEMATGWLNLNGKWYYLEGSGAMKIGWLNLNGKWYYLDGSGAMKIGWLNLNGKWYYLEGSGVMKTGWLNLNGKWYYLDGSGAMKTGWLNLNGTWYYLEGSGVMKTGWLNLNGKWYYMYSSGKMATNTTIDGWKIDSNGVATPIK